MKRALFYLLLFAAAVVTGRAEEKIRISSFSTVLTEIAQQVGGDRVEVFSHIKPGVDPHDFEPKPGDLKVVAESRLVLLSAKHMEGYVAKLKESAGTAGRVVEVGDQFPSLKPTPGAEGQHGGEDPHWWHSVSNAERATKVVRDELIRISPADKSYFAQNADRYLARLEALQKWARSKVAELPRNKRKLVTSHDAFQYLAQEYGFSVYPIEGVTSADQPSSKKVADIIRTVKEQGVKAIFAEQIENPKVLMEITRETGAALGGELYADGLGEGDAATYEGMMKHNISTIVDALK